MNCPNVKIKPNYISDDEGLPSSHAPGGKADIECKDSEGNALIEVTLLTGSQQNIREMPAIAKHLREFKIINNNTISVFISPRVHEYSVEYAGYLKHKDNLDIITMAIEGWLHNINDNATLYSKS